MTVTVQPYVVLWYSDADPQIAPGVAAPPGQLLVRTDIASFYYKSGPNDEDWTLLANLIPWITDPRDTAQLYDDFLTSYQSTTAVTAGGTSTVGAATDASGAAILTATGVGDDARNFSSPASIYFSNILGNDYSTTMDFRFNIIDLSGGGQNYVAKLGFANGGAAPTNGAYLRHDSTSPNWIVQSLKAGVLTSNVTTTPVTTGWHKCQQLVFETGCIWAIDDVFLFQQVIGLPSVAAEAVSPSWYLQKSLGAVQRRIEIDYYRMYQYFSPKR